MLFIDPDVCIDCNACLTECPGFYAVEELLEQLPEARVDLFECLPT